MKIFNSKYPIVCVAMNKISNADLAVAISNAGCVPSISSFFYETENNSNEDIFNNLSNALEYYNENTHNSDVILSISGEVLLSKYFKNLYFKNYFSHVELILTLDQYRDINFIELIKEKIIFFKSHGCKFLLKTVDSLIITLFEKKFPKLFDAYVLKSQDAAGSVVKRSFSLDEEIKKCLTNFPYVQIIASGGVGNSNQIKELLDLGVCAVGIGTLFAISEESCMSVDLKNKLIKSSSDDITYIEKSKQNAIVYSHVTNDDSNNTLALKQAVNTGKNGLVFIGKGIDNVCEIKSVESIVKDLVSDLYR
jgi:NAD(P)H-dependent flavin oxidoreductase YrpB (nitropropane dioxygenase family)